MKNDLSSSEMETKSGGPFGPSCFFVRRCLDRFGPEGILMPMTDAEYEAWLKDQDAFLESDWLKVGTGEKTGFFADFPIPGTHITRKYDAGDTFWNLSDEEKDKKARQDTLNELSRRDTARIPKVRTSHHRNKEEAARLQALVNERHNGSSAGNGDLDDLASELTDSLKPQGELRPLCLKAAESIADLRKANDVLHALLTNREREIEQLRAVPQGDAK